MDTLKRHFSGIVSWAPWIILTTGLIAYANSFECPFIFDDAIVVTKNPHIFYLWPPWEAVLAPTRCLADYSFALTYAWAGFSPAEYRLVNIVIHLGSALLLYGLIRRSLLLARWELRYRNWASPLALAIALLWVVHPLQTECVTYIAQRIEAMMGFFFLLTFYCFLRAATSTAPKRWMIFATLACAAGMATKEVMIIAPPLLLLYDWIFLANSQNRLRLRWRWHLATWATGLILIVLLRASILRAASENVPLVGAGDVQLTYALTQLNVIAHYLKLAFIPYPLCLDYRWPLVSSPLEVIWPGLLTLMLGMGTLWALLKRSWLGFMGAWFFFILAPTSSFNPLPDAAFEHRMYLPLASVIAVAVIAGFHGIQRLPSSMRSKTEWIVTTLIAVLFAGLTLARNESYRTEEGMWRNVIQTQPDNHRAYATLSAILLNQDRPAEAQAVTSNLLTRLPPFENWSSSEVETRYGSPGKPPLHMYYALAQNNLGQAEPNLELAKHHYNEAIRVFPGAFWAHRNLGNVYYLEKRLDSAIAEWETTLAWQPKDAQTYGSLGLAWSEKHDYRRAAENYAKAVAIKPDFWFARGQWAWLLATCPSNDVRDGTLALHIAHPLLEAVNQEGPRVFDIAAAAYAEQGDFSNAMVMASEAIKQAQAKPRSSQDAVTVELLKRRLESYKSGHPWRE